ncbi:unnamed protein product, partial [Rotaria sp. Silwood2]
IYYATLKSIDKLIAIKKALARFDQQRDRDTEILRTVTEN